MEREEGEMKKRGGGAEKELMVKNRQVKNSQLKVPSKLSCLQLPKGMNL